MPDRYMAIETGSHVVTSDEATANTVAITVANLITIAGVIVQVVTSANLDKGSVADISFATNVLTVADNGAFDLATGDIIYYIAFPA